MSDPLEVCARLLLAAERGAMIERMRLRGCRNVGFGRPGYGSLRDRVFSSLVRKQRAELEALMP